MDKEFISYPRTVVQLGEEIKRAVDLYWDRGIEEDQLKDLIKTWAGTGLLLEGADLNKTVNKLIGKKRKRVILMMLNGFQYKI